MNNFPKIQPGGKKMNFINKITVVPKLPEEIIGLKELSENMWWTWNYKAQQLFKKIDETLWNTVQRNPVVFLVEFCCSR